jgi:hypothetical protein
MKRNVHTMVPKPKLRILSGAADMSTYTFGTHVAKHMFCKTCGVVPFYSPRWVHAACGVIVCLLACVGVSSAAAAALLRRSNPDAWGVTVACVDPKTLRTVAVKTFDGTNWEASYSATNIAALTRPPDS